MNSFPSKNGQGDTKKGDNKTFFDKKESIKDLSDMSITTFSHDYVYFHGFFSPEHDSFILFDLKWFYLAFMMLI